MVAAEWPFAVSTAASFYRCCFLSEGGTCVEPGAPTCTHLVIDDRTTRTVPFELHGRVHVVKSEVSCVAFAYQFVCTRLLVCGSGVV